MTDLQRYAGHDWRRYTIMQSESQGGCDSQRRHLHHLCANYNTSVYTMVQRCDPRGYGMMNILDYLIGNTDRHWGNSLIRKADRYQLKSAKLSSPDFCITWVAPISSASCCRPL